MCLPHCPTYITTQLESESPRGRIAIIQGLVTNKISHNKTALAHIDNCLTCRACEKICPSGVSYGSLLDQFKSLPTTNIQPLTTRLFKSLIRLALLNSNFNKLVIIIAKMLRLKKAIGLSTTPSMTTAIYHSHKLFYPTNNSSLQSEKNTVGLFVGCTGSSFDVQTLNDAIIVLNAIGFDVKLSPTAKCCGALDSHAGREQQATQFATDNVNAFKNLNVDHIVYFASGCGAQLSEYKNLEFTNKLSEISKFIHTHWPDSITFKNSKQSIALHEPCTHRNVLKESDIGYQLLKRIPELIILPLTENKFCCGAAGDYMMTHKTMANTLRAPKLKELSQLKPDLLLTTNIGCALHLRKGLYRNKQAIPVMHPVSFIAELLTV